MPWLGWMKQGGVSKHPLSSVSVSANAVEGCLISCADKMRYGLISTWWWVGLHRRPSKRVS